MKTCKFVLGIFLVSGAVMSAEETSTPQYEVGLNYSWLHVNAYKGSSQRTGNGGSGVFAYNLNGVLGLVADFGGYANTRVNDTLLTYMFGPRFSWRHSKLTPYVQFLFGGARVSNSPAGIPSITQNAFATAAGGGLDYQVSNHIAIKPIQVEYVMTQINSALAGPSNQSFGSHQNDVRYSGGVVFRFGSK